MKAIVLILGILTLTSCAMHDISQEVDSLFTGSVCCNDFSQIKYTKIDGEDDIGFKINKRSPIFNFNEGKSFYSAFELPNDIQDYEIDLRSYFSGTVFYPIVTVLDKNYNLIEVVSDENIKYIDSSKAWRAYIGGKFKLNSSAKYILVHTPIGQVGRSHESTGVIATPFIVMTNVKAEQPYSPAGSLNLMITRLN